MGMTRNLSILIVHLPTVVPSKTSSLPLRVFGFFYYSLVFVLFLFFTEI